MPFLLAIAVFVLFAALLISLNWGLRQHWRATEAEQKLAARNVDRRDTLS